jgi:hypothetical protein
MPLAPSVKMAAHFTAYEMGADKPEATATIIANLYKVAAWLEIARTIIRREIGAVTESDPRGKLVMGRRSGFRTLAENGSVTGSPTSDHLTGLAADFTPQGVSLWDAYHILESAAARGELPAFDQLIYYAYDGHIHVGLGSRMRSEYRIQFEEGGRYLLATNDLIDKLPGAVRDVIAQASSTLSGIPSWLRLLAFAVLVFIIVRS